MKSKLIDLVQKSKNNYNGPMLIFDLRLIRRRLDFLLKLEAKHNCKFLMPVKSFRHPAIYEMMNKYLSGFDISNYREYSDLPTNLYGKLISLTDPSYNGYDLNVFSLKRNKFLVYIENIEQHERLQYHQNTIDFGIRLNSESLKNKYEPDSHTKDSSRFGIDFNDINILEKITKSSKHNFIGFHIHNGFSSNSFNDVVNFAKNISSLKTILKVDIEQISLGGGLTQIGFQHINKLIQDIRCFIDPKIRLVFEPGNLLFEGSGFACGRVESRNISSAGQTYTLDISKECHLRWSQPRLLRNFSEELSNRNNIVFYGPTCYEHDKIGEFQVGLSNENDFLYEIGGMVLFSNINGYCVSWNTTFNGIEKALVEFIS